MTITTPAKSFGYVRVSTTSQTNDRQIDALKGAGIDSDDIYSDKISGARQSRPGLDSLLKVVRAGDSITVHSLDRLGRTALHVMQTIAELEARDVEVVSLKGSEQKFNGATGKFLRDILILVAELERGMNAERVAEARAARAARAQGGEQVAGRPRTALTPANIAKVKARAARGQSVAEIVKLEGMSRASVYRALATNP